MCSQEQADAFFRLAKTSLAVWQRQVAELQKAAAAIQDKQSLFPEE